MHMLGFAVCAMELLWRCSAALCEFTSETSGQQAAGRTERDACEAIWQERRTMPIASGTNAGAPAATASSACLQGSHPLPPDTGIPVSSPANNSVPGYRQHLGQALLGAHDIPKSLCPDSTRLDFCRFEATLEVRCRMGRYHGWAAMARHHGSRFMSPLSSLTS